MATQQKYNERNIEDYFITEEPYYVPTSDEIEIFESAYRQRVPILLKGPTGTGKTRFIEHMAWRLSEGVTSRNPGQKSRNGTGEKLPLITVACHEDLTASDLVGRYLLDADGTRWIDGPLTRAVKFGGICYLD
jgi:nitric oxide reductase NorQ protein